MVSLVVLTVGMKQRLVSAVECPVSHCITVGTSTNSFKSSSKNALWRMIPQKSNSKGPGRSWGGASLSDFEVHALDSDTLVEEKNERMQMQEMPVLSR